MGFVDHGRGGSGEPVAGLLRPGNAGSNTAADHIEATKLALAQLPAHLGILMAVDTRQPSGLRRSRDRPRTIT